MTVLVTGGAGYVGAHMILALMDAGEDVVALDDLSTGADWLVPDGIKLVVGDVGDRAILEEVFKVHSIHAVIHFAGSLLIGESMTDPNHYYRNNTMNTLTLLEACVAQNVKHFIFSSTASVYGTPERIPVSESAPVNSITPYGASMAMSERVLSDAAKAYGLKYATLRYFNVAGADPKGRAGEIGKPTHLIKVAAQIAVGVRKEQLQIYGNDYPTPDGTAIRDYVHVSDLAEAHLQALEKLRAGGGSMTVNCGYGRGYSVREVIDAVCRVAGTDIDFAVGERRPGDPPQLIADSAAIRTFLDWRPRYDDLEFILRTAVEWEAKLLEKSQGH